MMEIAELEQRLQRLQGQLIDALAHASRLAKDYGLTPEQSYLLPAIDSTILADNDPAFRDSNEDMRKLDAEHRRKMELLPPDVRAARVLSLELNEMVCDVQIELALALAKSGQTIKRIAERLGTTTDLISEMLWVGGSISIE